MAEETPRYAVVTGGNRGIGFEICRQLASKGIRVILTSRDENRGLEAVEILKKELQISDQSIVFHQLDVTDLSSITSLAEFVETHFGKLDILINNAGVVGMITDVDALRAGTGKSFKWEETITETYELAEECIKINYYGPKRMCEATHNRLATGDRMQSWNSGLSANCVFCHASMETRNHLFFTCSYSSQIWSKLVQGLLLRRYTTSFQEILSLISGSTYKGSTRLILRYAFQATIHTLWKERNSRRHGELPNSAAQLTTFLDRTIRNRLSSLQEQSSSKFEDGLQVWFGTRT